MITTDTNPFAVQQALESMKEMEAQEEAPVELPPTRFPVDGEVKLVGGILDPTGLIDTATVRELNGRDEEVIAKAPSVAKAMLTILNRGVDTLGGEQARPEDLDSLLGADRDLLLIKIREVTFGSELEFQMTCPACGETNDATLDISTDIPIKYLEDPIRDRFFSVPLKNGGVAECRLITGVTQKAIANSVDTKTLSELNTTMLYGCIKTINGRDVLDVSQVLNLGMADRSKIVEELAERTPGPQWNEVSKECPNCGEEVPLPMSAGDLFRF